MRASLWEWLSNTEYKDEWTNDHVDVSSPSEWMWEVEWVGMWEVEGMGMWEVEGVGMWEVEGVGMWEVEGVGMWEVEGVGMWEVEGVGMWEVEGVGTFVWVIKWGWKETVLLYIVEYTEWQMMYTGTYIYLTARGSSQ